MGEGIRIAQEGSRTGNSEVPVHIQVYTENHSVFGLFVARISRFDFFLDCDVELVCAVTLVECCLFPLLVVLPVLYKWRPLVVFRGDELGGHAVANGGERYVVVIVRDGAPVVYDD